MFERRVFQDNGDGTVSFGQIDCYRRAATVRPVLDALAGLGMARRLSDGRYAA